MNLTIKFVIYILIISSEVDYLLSRPVAFKNAQRKKRQVVQPKWLSGPDRKPIDSNVRINDQNLKEAAAIRDAIQKAINDGTFAVDTNEPNVPIPKADTRKPKTEVTPTFPKFEMPQFDWPKFEMPQFEMPQFEMPQFDTSKWNIEFLNAEQRTTLLKHLHELWQHFWDTSKKVISMAS